MSSKLTCPFAAIQMAIQRQGGDLAVPADPGSNLPRNTRDYGVKPNPPNFPPMDMDADLLTIHEGSPFKIQNEMRSPSLQFNQEMMVTPKEMKLDMDDGKSAGGYSRGQGSRAPTKSRGGSDARSMISSAKTSRTRKNKIAPKVRRTKQTPKFSQWEAETYIPKIKESWDLVRQATDLQSLGLKLYEGLFKEGGAEVENMFSAETNIMANKFAAMLDSIVKSVEEPKQIYKKLRGLGPMHLQKGVTKDHLPIMGKVLFRLLEECLKDAFDAKMKAAWDWLWSWLGSVVNQTLEEAGNNSTLVSQSWDIACDYFPDDQVGEMFFDTLLEMAPNLHSVFSKPRQVLSLKFTEMLGTLVGLQGKADDSNEQLRWMGIRHVKYAAKRQHIEALGQVILITMEKAVGDEWTFEMMESWKALWEQVCSVMMTITEKAEQHGPQVQEVY
mmetsp:Transcript_2693/g.4326  ORF Transcript_2693/g.4326 Transcript_2693/m.4326 type:complete len:442 (+) Transcript_2693:215-1540(+)